MFRPSCALSIAFLVACLAGVGCGGSTKTIAGSPPAGTASQPGTVAPAGGSSTKTAGSSTTPGSATGGTGSTSTPETQPLTGGSTPGTSRTSTGSTTPSSTTKSKTSVTPSSVQAACEHAIAQKPGISAALKAKAEQICKQAANRVLSRSSTLEREVCMRVVNSSKVSPEVKAQALARCRGL